MTTIYHAKGKGYYIIAAREHADNELVCAAISSAMCGLCNTIQLQTSIKPGECEGFSENSGKCTVRWFGGCEANAVYQFVMDIFKTLESTYPENIKILPYCGGENISEMC